MRKNVNFRPKLIKAKDSEDVTSFPLTLEQRVLDYAAKKADEVKVNMRKVFELELAQLFNDTRFDIDISQCNHSVIRSWFKESPRIFIESPLFVPEEDFAYLALDYKSAHKTADLCLGGQFNSLNPSSDEDVELPAELSSTENRICCRLLQRQIQGMQNLLFKERSTLLGEVQKYEELPDPLNYLAFKVRFILENEVISWFLWLPITFFSDKTKTISHKESNAEHLSMDAWPQFAVQGKIEMAKKKVTLKQLKECMNGKILPIELNEPALFKLGNKNIFKGQVVEQDTGLAFQITELTNKETSSINYE
ncbi:MULTISPECIES: FliM/FliN family flagellar motor C-terminal domain-containing protein [Pseudoalteromonas]|jgi:flagellar motor switch protein FliM|uniref:Flagellar motor switch protein FliN-like C-terminal domain-containing protein n=2 Tax=Pseudoalteromonas TaxID=53246 RepID=A0ABR9DZX1_9GAMM|nr:FliM/FliN family flagellar motor C-terminal domain-containing protein [Pseudoalteromonas aliena]MBE0359879.1 hypothetical protein [Pseudoalteromonas aliena SW19]